MNSRRNSPFTDGNGFRNLRRDNKIQSACIAVENSRNDGINAAIDNLIIFKADIRLIRMHIHIDNFRRNVDKQDIKRVLPLHQIAGVRIGNGRRNRIVRHVPSVYKGALIGSVRLCKIRSADVSANADTVLYRVKLIALPDDGRAVNGGRRFLHASAV